jgi:hypothetical protein
MYARRIRLECMSARLISVGVHVCMTHETGARIPQLYLQTLSCQPDLTLTEAVVTDVA